MLKETRKVFVVDTSLLLHDPDAIRNFDDNIVVIPFPVLEELDHHKGREGNGTAVYARRVIRLLDEFRGKGQIHRGVETPGRGILLVDNEGFIPGDINLKADTTDNFILAVALKWKFREVWLQRRRNGNSNGNRKNALAELNQRFAIGNVCVVTKDINLRVKAGACGLIAQDYLRDRAVASETQLYSGIARIAVDDSHYKEIARPLCSTRDGGKILCSTVASFITLPELLPNQCCVFNSTLEDEEKTQLAIYKDDNIEPPYFRHIQKPKAPGAGRNKNGIEPRNVAQAFALALLEDETIQIVTLSGIAGSGKTLMALLAGLDQLNRSRFEQILVYRSNTEIGEPLGFLKGGLHQKFSPWAAPIHDILELLGNGDEREIFETPNKKKAVYNVDGLLGDGKILIQPINFVRGRSFHHKYVVVDETQNFKPGDIKKVITRVGKGTKIVLTGDVQQIDNLYLDAVSNGLAHVIERMKGQPMFGHITLEKSERSGLAELAAKIL